jgi:hypothetical protein
MVIAFPAYFLGLRIWTITPSSPTVFKSASSRACTSVEEALALSDHDRIAGAGKEVSKLKEHYNKRGRARQRAARAGACSIWVCRRAPVEVVFDCTADGPKPTG